MTLLKRPLVLIGFALASAGCAAFVVWVLSGLPDLSQLDRQLNSPSIRIEDRYGRLLYEVLPEDGGRHTSVPLESIPLALRQATIATEDSRFYEHSGVDAASILRALWNNLTGQQAFSGGSTLPQQLARSLLMDAQEQQERSLRRKLREAVLAWQLSARFEKDELLSLYLNQTYYGGMAYGVQAAASTYFGKPVSDLDLAESALLAGLPQAPGLYNPYTDLAAARARQRVVLGRMQAEGYLNEQQRLLAEREPIVLAEAPYPMQAPHYVMGVRAQLDRLFTLEQVRQAGGLVVRTTLDLDWQQHAERAIAHHLDALQRSPDGRGHNVNSAAMVALDPRSGEILAMVGSPDYFDANHGGAINMAAAPRQPGSALKPLVYAAALDPSQSQPWNAASLLWDVSTSFVTHEGRAYVPSNYDQREHGPVLVRDALGSSLNVPAVITLEHVGLQPLFSLSEKLGLTTLKDPDRYDLSLALGGGEVRLVELAAAYGVFANGGYRVEPVSILEVSSPSGEMLYEHTQTTPRRVLDERVAWLVSDILSDNDARRLGFGPNTVLRLDRPAAVKTGTTTNFHDNWTIGYTPSLVAGVWVGNTDYQPMREVTGLTGAAPIWHAFLRGVLAGQAEETFRRPPGLVQVEICTLSGLLPTPACPYRRLEWFISGTQPTTYDTFYQEVLVDPATGDITSSQRPAEHVARRVVLDLPPQAEAWARQNGLPLLSDLRNLAPPNVLPVQAGSLHPAQDQAGLLHLSSPAPYSTFRLSAGFALEAQRVRVEAVGASGMSEVSLWVDGEPLSCAGASQAQPNCTTSPYQAWWTLSPGQHQAWAEALAQDGQRVRSPVVQFEVMASP